MEQMNFCQGAGWLFSQLAAHEVGQVLERRGQRLLGSRRGGAGLRPLLLFLFGGGRILLAGLRLAEVE